MSTILMIRTFLSTMWESALIVDNGRDVAALIAFMDSLDDIAELLRAARALVGIRQDELATRAQVSRQMVARIESGGKGVAFETIEKVRAALEREGVDFFSGTDAHGPAIARRKGEKRARLSAQ